MRPSIVYGIVGLAAGAALAACSGSGGAITAPPDAGATGDAASMDAGAAGDSGSSSGGGDGAATDGALDEGGAGDGGGAREGGAVSCTSPDASALPYAGIVELSRITMTPPPARWAGIAQFYASTPAAPSGCSGTAVGACCYEMTSSSAPTMVSAGTITVSTAAGATLGTMTPPTYVASNSTTTTFTWTPGTSLMVSGAGATIDPFSASVVAPALLAGVSPALSAAITVSLKSDLVVSWTPAKEACSQISFGLSQGALMPHIGCVVDDAAGTLTVPASLLGMFTATTGTAVMERIEGKKFLTAHAGLGLVAIDVLQTTATYTP